MPTILVADDNSNIHKMVSLAFENQGIDVVAVGNGEAAVRRLQDVRPDVVLVDVFMPVRNGYEVCEFIKRDPRFKHVPVILLVGAFDPYDEKEARRVGAHGVLKKPFVPPDPLIAMVASALENSSGPEGEPPPYEPIHPPDEVIPCAEEQKRAVAARREPPEPERGQSFPPVPGVDPAVVHAVVEKVLERIQPEIHEILANDILRPLVESLLQRELQKQ